jgi:TonB family protein
MNPNPAQYGGSFQQAPQPQQKGCIGRNWKWMLPVGCLGAIIGVVLLVGGIIFAAMSAVRSSEVYQGALKIAQAHPAVVERLGEPVKDGWLVQGNINYQGGSGNANFDIPVSGPKNSGTLRVSAVKPDGSWMYQRLDLVTGGETVSLLDRNVALPDAPEVDVEEDADGSAPEDAAEEPEESGDDAEAQARILQGAANSNSPIISGGVLNGKAVSKPQPAYPPAAKAARAAGTVTVQVVVDESGGVASAEAVSGHPLLRAAAVAAARQAKFSPTLLSGKPVRVSGVLTYNFVLEQ